MLILPMLQSIVHITQVRYSSSTWDDEGIANVLGVVTHSIWDRMDREYSVSKLFE